MPGRVTRPAGAQGGARGAGVGAEGRAPRLGRLVVIEGSAGIGKTRLLEEARGGARAGMRVWPPAGPNSSANSRSRSCAGVRARVDGARAERAGGAAGGRGPAGPVVGLASPPADAGAPADPLFTTLNALYWLTSNLAEAQPTLLAVDDAQWSDSPSLRFFRFLVPRLDDLPVVLAVAARPAEGDAGTCSPSSSPIRGERDPAARAQPDAVAELVREGLSADADHEFCLACHEVSGGNPFMLRELLVELAADGTAGRRRGGARARGRARDDPAGSARAAGAAPRSAPRLARAVAVLGDEPRSPTPPSSRDWIAPPPMLPMLSRPPACSPPGGRCASSTPWCAAPFTRRCPVRRGPPPTGGPPAAFGARRGTRADRRPPARDRPRRGPQRRRGADRGGAARARPRRPRDRDRVPAPRACRAAGRRRAPRSAAAARARVLSSRGP